jgi:hypothetical protein
LFEPEQEKRADLPFFSRRQLFELGIAALISRLAQLDGTRVSEIEREVLSRALSESIVDGWKHLFLLDNAQIVAIGRATLERQKSILRKRLHPFPRNGCSAAS